ncbi:hypothetical protein ACMFMG_000810 [Clarireedia jacksonii]
MPSQPSSSKHKATQPGEPQKNRSGKGTVAKASAPTSLPERTKATTTTAAKKSSGSTGSSSKGTHKTNPIATEAQPRVSRDKASKKRGRSRSQESRGRAHTSSKQSSLNVQAPSQKRQRSITPIRGPERDSELKPLEDELAYLKTELTRADKGHSNKEASDLATGLSAKIKAYEWTIALVKERHGLKDKLAQKKAALKLKKTAELEKDKEEIIAILHENMRNIDYHVENDGVKETISDFDRCYDSD